MDPHGIEVLDGADDDAVVGLVPDDLHLVFLPTEKRLLDEHFGGRRHVESAPRDGLQFLAVVGDAPSGAPEREGGPDDERVGADVLRDLQNLVDRVGGSRVGDLQADIDHDLLEQGSILAPLDRLGIGPDQSDSVFFQHAVVDEFHRRIQRGLAAKGGKEGVGLFPLDDFLDDRRGDRFDIGPVGKLRIGHDRGRIGIHQHHLVSFLRQRLARLHPRVIELAPLTDHDGSGADQQDFVDGGVFGHGS